MRHRVATVLATAILFLAPTPSRADLSNYIQNFEELPKLDTTALGNDGWLVFGTVFRDAPGPPVDTTFFYEYGPFPAPNDGAAFCAIDTLQGGPSQGTKQLSVYSDYNNVDHATGRLIDSAVYREWTIGSKDVGNTWIFEFDAKRGNLVPPTTAMAFIKTLDPSAGYALTNLLKIDMTTIPVTWEHYLISIFIDAGLENQLLQIGFSNFCTGYDPSGVFYDNIVVHNAVSTAVEVTESQATRRPAALVSPNPLNPAGVLSFRTATAGPVTVKLFDLNGRFVRTLLDRQVLPAGSHRVAIDGRDQAGQRLPSGVYFYRMETPAGAARGKFSVLK